MAALFNPVLNGEIKSVNFLNQLPKVGNSSNKSFKPPTPCTKAIVDCNLTITLFKSSDSFPNKVMAAVAAPYPLAKPVDILATLSNLCAVVLEDLAICSLILLNSDCLLPSNERVSLYSLVPISKSFRELDNASISFFKEFIDLLLDLVSILITF